MHKNFLLLGILIKTSWNLNCFLHANQAAHAPQHSASDCYKHHSPGVPVQGMSCGDTSVTGGVFWLNWAVCAWCFARPTPCRLSRLCYIRYPSHHQRSAINADNGIHHAAQRKLHSFSHGNEDPSCQAVQ